HSHKLSSRCENGHSPNDRSHNLSREGVGLTSSLRYGVSPMTPDRRSFLAAGAISLPVALQPRLAGAADVEKPGKTKNTKFAVNLEMWWGKEKNFLKKLEYAAALGFPAVELWPWENKDVNAVAETCERLGLTIAQFSAWGFKPGLNDPKNHSQF